jgi:hypothetical protein
MIYSSLHVVMSLLKNHTAMPRKRKTASQKEEEQKEKERKKEEMRIIREKNVIP